MTSDPTTAPPVEALLPGLLAEPRLAPLFAEAGPWWLWSADGSRLIATNAAGARAMGATGAAMAMSRAYAPSHAFAGQIARLAATLVPDGPARTDRLRVYGRFGSESAVAVIDRLAVEGADLVSAALPAAARGPSREALAAILAEWPHPVLVFAADGSPVSTSAAAAVLAGHSLQALTGDKAETLLAETAAGGRTSLPLVTGALHLLAVPVAEALVGILPAAEAETAREGLRLVSPEPPPAIVEKPAEEAAPEAEKAADEPVARENVEEPVQEAPPEAAKTADKPAAPDIVEDGPEVPQRFSWRLDAAQRFHSIEPREVAAPVGLTLAEASERFGLDPEGALTAAVTASRPFSGVPAVWPLAETQRRLAVTLAAFPAQRDGAFHGYAGFGLIVEEVAPARQETTSEAGPAAPAPTAEAEKAPEAEAAPAPSTEAEAVSEPDAEAASAHSAEAEAVPESDAASTAGALVPVTEAETTPEPEAVSPTAEVETVTEAEAVPAPPPETASAPTAESTPATEADQAPEAHTDRRPTFTVHTKSDNVVALRTSVGQDPKRLVLSPGERNAFREIARALGARTEAEAPTQETPAQSAPAQEPPASESVPPQTLATDPAAAEKLVDEAPSAAPELTPPAAAPETAPPLVPRPAVFVDSGTPFGPWPSAFGASPAEAPAEAPPATLASAPSEPVPAAPEPVAPAPDPGLKALLDRLPLGLLVHRGNAVLFANRTLLDWTGFPDAAALEQAGGLSRLFASEAAEEKGETALSLTTAAGVVLPVEAHLSRTNWAGEPAFVFTLRRPEAEPAHEPDSELSDLRGRLDEVEQILDTATDGIVIVNADATIESMNRSAEALFGYESAEVKGRSVNTLFAPESHRSALDYCDGLLSNGVASVLNDGRQIIGRVKQGGLIPLYMTMGRTGPTSRPKLAAVFRDMTQWKKAEEDLIAARRQAEQASSQKSDFLAKISHEIRTPLNAIIGFSEVMMEERFGPVGNERYRDYLKDIHASGGHVLSLINDLLDLSKIEAGKLEMSFTSVDLNDVVQSTVAIMQPQANRERVIIRSSLQARLPNVVADARSLRQIVLNLLSNSVKFTPAGGQIIVSTALSEAGEAVLRVRDTGVGMSEMELKAAMEPFRQVATSNPHAAKGTGLGLPLTKALVEANRASFGISSTPNQGTLVEVVFPPTRVLAE